MASEFQPSRLRIEGVFLSSHRGFRCQNSDRTNESMRPARNLSTTERCINEILERTVKTFSRDRDKISELKNLYHMKRSAHHSEINYSHLRCR